MPLEVVARVSGIEYLLLDNQPGGGCDQTEREEQFQKLKTSEEWKS
jgi:hypothetical protein